AEPLERGRHLGAGFLGLAVELAAEARLEAVVAQDPQVILADALPRVADEPHAAGGEIGEAAEPVIDLERRRVRVEGVDGEVAPFGVLAPFAPEGDGRPAPVGA